MLAGYWHQIPFVRIVIPMAVGVGINMFFPMPLIASILALTLSALVLLIVWKYYQFKIQTILFGIFFNLVFAFSGTVLHNSHHHLNYQQHFTNYPSQYLVVTLTEPPLLRKNSIKCKAEVLQAVSPNSTKQVDGYLMLYFEKDSSLLSKLNYGSCLLIKNTSQEIKGPQNPYEFNYKRYLAFNQIFRQAYLTANNFIVIDKNGGNILWKIAYQAQAFFNKTLLTYVKSTNEIAISKALLYGYDDDIDPDLVRAYSNTGTLHVLAVSGMHVGLIFWLINLVLKYFDKKKYQRVLKAIISLSIIWAYSLLCGLSPSILRASVMFSFVALGNMVQNKPNIYNTLAASAFTLLLFDSNMLASVGFQLSFLAVFGIVSIQKYFKQWFTFKYWLSNEIWNIISVSIAAQLATFPLGLLYFHQFPVYFLASNLLIIPLTTGIIFIAIAMIAAAGLAQLIPFFSYLAWAFGFLVKWLIYITNIIVLWLEKLPFSYITGIQITEIETILIFIAVAFACDYFITRKQYLAKNALLFFVLVFLVNAYEDFKIENQKFITIYNINKTLAMQIVNGTQSTIIADSSLLHNPDKFHFHLQQHIWASGINKVDTIPFNQNLQLKINQVNINLGNRILPNYTNILTGKTDIDSSQLAPATKIILSSKLNKNQTEKIIGNLKTKNILTESVLENGAITINIEPQ
ncbi:MAG: ComEC family competence protein [Bacteroidia bacterium]|nr:ComEC family competence protein [Bacteroidia bacterium]